MALRRNLLNFWNKRSYDFERPDISLYNFHPQLRLIYILNGIFFNKNKDSRVRFILPIANTTICLAALGLQYMVIYHGIDIQDYALASECLCYTMILGTAPTLYISTLYNRDNILVHLDELNEFFISMRKLGKRYRDHFIKGQLLIWKGCWVWLTFMWTAGGIYILNGVVILLYYSIFATHDEHSVRPLIFPLWLPHDDPNRTPNYEIFMFCEMWVIAIISQNFGSYVYMTFHFMLHYYNVMDLIIMDLDVLFEGLDESVVNLPKNDSRRMEVQRILNTRMKRIVDWHTTVFRGVDMVSSVYGPPLAYQVLFSSIIICIVTYQVVDSLEKGGIDVFFCILWFEAILQMWIPCYLGTLVRDKALSIADECWNCGWQNTSLGQLVCVDLVTIMLRSQKILTIKFTGLPNLSLETYSSVLSTAYSYYNMLRQSTK